MKVYIAAPFFNIQQIALVEGIKEILDTAQIDYFSPKDECIFEKGKTKPKDILDINLNEIKKCDTMIAVTEGKDMGTLFECGYAHAIGKDIIYFWDNQDPTIKFNLMLSESGYCVARNKIDLISSINSLKSGYPWADFDGELE